MEERCMASRRLIEEMHQRLHLLSFGMQFEESRSHFASLLCTSSA